MMKLYRRALYESEWNQSGYTCFGSMVNTSTEWIVRIEAEIGDASSWRGH